MSTDIIFNQFFVKLPVNEQAIAQMEQLGGFDLPEYDKQWLRFKSSFFWLMETGSNNTFDRQGRIAKSWGIVAAGEYMIHRALAMCTDIEGGMLRLGKKATTPESFLKAVRGKLKEAVELTDLDVPRIRWSLPAALLDLSAPEPNGDRERRIHQAAQNLVKHPYTAHLIASGRIKAEKDSWPYDKEIVVRFESGGSADTTFLPDYLWLSMLDTYYGEMAFRRDCSQSLSLTFEDWASNARRRAA